MERLVRIDQSNIRITRPDEFALQQILRRFRTSREYLVGEQWIPGSPSVKPEGSRIVFSDRAEFKVAVDAYLTWLGIKNKQVYPPVEPEKVIDRVIRARREQQTLLLFAPWGVRPSGDFGEPEQKVFDMLKEFKSRLLRNNIPAQVLLMPADLYATEINQIDPNQALRYFRSVTEEASERGFEVKPWSKIREENVDYYQQRAKTLTEEAIDEILRSGTIERALETAGRRSGYFDPTDIESSAFAYLRERIVEAEIIEGAYKPVKVSLVEKSKDAGVDRDLPRIYIIPRELQFPWLK